MGDIFAFIGGLIILLGAGALAYHAIRCVFYDLRTDSARLAWFYFPCAVLLTIITCRAAMFCLDLINIYFISSLIGFD